MITSSWARTAWRFTGGRDTPAISTFSSARAPNRIDLLTSLDGVATDEALATRLDATIDSNPVFILSKAALIKNKRAVGRPQDLADIEALRD